jgi:hypothetical protein
VTVDIPDQLADMLFLIKSGNDYADQAGAYLSR